MKKKGQRRFQRSKEYVVIGPAKRERIMLFVAPIRLDDGKEYLLFRPLRKMKKQRRS